MWLEDGKGRKVGVPADKIGYVEMTADDATARSASGARPEPTSVAGPDLLGRRLLVVTGKGGVGKSTVAAALALVAAERGQRVLVVDVDAKGTIADRFEAGPIGFKPREVMPGVSLMAMDTEASLAEYLRLNLRVPIIGRLGPLAGMLDFVATAAPGVREILTIGKVCWEVRESIEGRADWDLVIVDAAATGHVIAQLGAADAIGELVAVGPVRGQTAVDERAPRRSRDHGAQRGDHARGDAGGRRPSTWWHGRGPS